MIDFNTILSSFNEKGTLLKWLKKLEQAINEDTIYTFNVEQIDDTHIKFTFTFEDGTTYESDTIELPKGDKGDTGATGLTGNGIASIAKTGTSGLVDTYTITFTNGTTTSFNVTNGANGEDGQDGATGNGILSITKTGTSGLVDTYTITFTNGTTTTFNVTNGANGTNGTNGVGVVSGGTTGQALVKASNTDFDTQWATIGSGANRGFNLNVTVSSLPSVTLLCYINGALTNVTIQNDGNYHTINNVEYFYVDTSSCTFDVGKYIEFNYTIVDEPISNDSVVYLLDNLDISFGGTN